MYRDNYIGWNHPSYDLETEIDELFPIDHITEQMIFDAAKTFEGDIQQFPPAHSAIKINGERVYAKARRGEEVEIKSRQVRINSFEIEKSNSRMYIFAFLVQKAHTSDH
ncbi:hypothetical protein [Sphingobacterium sp. E70]|uniref:hypothetical protein n=1 Tax=Sphingobacterium sp. E70 TaxID=2853439 RepID=UPI00279590A6|nr:hypothetical protein [Sphingobacterium sp. E70]